MSSPFNDERKPITDNDKVEMLKKVIRVKILKVYEERGLQESIKVAKSYLNEAAKVGKQFNINDFGRLIRGELSEIYAEACVREYVKTHKNSFYVKGLCIPKCDRNTGKIVQGQFNELDLTLFTEKMIILIECKSYSGSTKLVDEGTLVSGNGRAVDVYNQSVAHLMSLNFQISKYKLISTRDTGAKGYILCMFDFSTGDNALDKRTDEAKRKFPLLNQDTFNNFISDLDKGSSKVFPRMWDIQKLSPFIKELHKDSEKNMELHLMRMKSKEYLKKKKELEQLEQEMMKAGE